MRKPTKMIGTTEACLQDFFCRHGRSPVLVEVTGISERSERRWRGDHLVPTGEALMRVRCFLQECGYGVKELDDTAESVQEVATCITLGCITLEKVTERLAMMEPHQFFTYFRGITPSHQRIDTLTGIWTECRPELERRRATLRVRLVEEKIIANTGDGPRRGNGASATIDIFAKACEDIITYGSPLLEGTRETRFAMRQKIGTGNAPLLHRAWQTLNSLLKETTKQL
jgi:hypothetical protein